MECHDTKQLRDVKNCAEKKTRVKNQSANISHQGALCDQTIELNDHHGNKTTAASLAVDI